MGGLKSSVFVEVSEYIYILARFTASWLLLQPFQLTLIISVLSCCLETMSVASERVINLKIAKPQRLLLKMKTFCYRDASGRRALKRNTFLLYLHSATQPATKAISTLS